MPESRLKLRMMIVSSLFAAIIGVLAQVTIPLPLVPITGQTLAIGLAQPYRAHAMGQFQSSFIYAWERLAYQYLLRCPGG